MGETFHMSSPENQHNVAIVTPDTQNKYHFHDPCDMHESINSKALDDFFQFKVELSPHGFKYPDLAF